MSDSPSGQPTPEPSSPKQIEKIKPEKEIKESFKIEKIEVKEHKDAKHEKLEKNETKEHKDAKHEKLEKNELKEHKDAKHEKLEKVELKEHKDAKIEIKDLKEPKIEFEKDFTKEMIPKRADEGPIPNPSNPVERGAGDASHFIGGAERPDLSRGALSGEPDTRKPE